MTSDRKLFVGAVALVAGEVPRDIEAGSYAQDQVEGMLGSEYFEGAAFQRVSVILRYGNHTNVGLEYEHLNREQGCLDISVRVDMKALQQLEHDGLVAVFRQALIEALIAVAQRYSRPCERLLAASRPEAILRHRTGRTSE